MASPKICTRNKGFTLIETLIVLGVLALVAGFSLFIDLNNYRGDAFRSEVSTLVTALQTARANALNNIDQKAARVAIQPSQYPQSYVLFEGAGFDSTSSLNEPIDGSYAVTIATSSPRVIVFDQLSGDVDYPGTIVLTDPERGVSATVSINSEGAIDW